MWQALCAKAMNMEIRVPFVLVKPRVSCSSVCRRAKWLFAIIIIIIYLASYLIKSSYNTEPLNSNNVTWGKHIYSRAPNPSMQGVIGLTNQPLQ